MSGFASGLPSPLCQEPLLYSITDLLGGCTNYSIPITDVCGRRALRENPREVLYVVIRMFSSHFTALIILTRVRLWPKQNDVI